MEEREIRRLRWVEHIRDDHGIPENAVPYDLPWAQLKGIHRRSHRRQSWAHFHLAQPYREAPPN
jgi:hypothetical protein